MPKTLDGRLDKGISAVVECSNTSVVDDMRLCLALIVAALPAGVFAQDIVLPPTGAPFDYQIGTSYAPDPQVRIVIRDYRDQIAAGLYNICYINGFQTQPEHQDFWLNTHPDLLLRDGDHVMEDPNWAGEYFLDTRSAGKRAAIFAVLAPWIADCAAKGFNAIETDNLDSFTRTNGLLSRAGNAALARMINGAAHGFGMASGQKNTLDLGAEGPALGFDFVIAESCAVFNECDTYRETYGNHMLSIEYFDEPETAFAASCAAMAGQVSLIRRDHNLTAPDHPDYRIAFCPA
ncbi:endo alpha-1,4 polygalactosaminidase [Ketogulonicigenium vulgare]|uniref:endo alpha-1,4 polygalactosaminidase n=1 Tax=Ketogulonicigenium vulgare TaxID=92945 RepID=UPI00235A38B6|nr:endo alpha-1,4 polygalactosaminidase [Ketogulonicigenium vulgare]